MKSVYLDYAAATPMTTQVLDAMAPYWSEQFYNPSAPYAPARTARRAFEDARARLAHAIGARPGNVTLTAGATEANNLAFASAAGPVVVSAIEHESVLACAEAHGARVVNVAKDGIVDLVALREAIAGDAELVSVSLANGEIGTIQPLRAIGDIVREERMRRLERANPTPLFLHTDASQAAGHISVNVSSLGVDMMTLSAAKLYGPKQVGLLWHADGVELRPLVLGGGQEGGLRSGTENVAGAVGFAVALEQAEALRPAESRRLRKLAALVRMELRKAVPDVVFSGPSQDARRLPGLVHASFPGVEARRLVIALERKGVYVGTGSACAASRMRVSHVLKAIGLSEDVAQGSLRISMGRLTTNEDIAYAIQIIAKSVEEERGRSHREVRA